MSSGMQLHNVGRAVEGMQLSLTSTTRNFSLTSTCNLA